MAGNRAAPAPGGIEPAGYVAVYRAEYFHAKADTCVAVGLEGGGDGEVAGDDAGFVGHRPARAGDDGAGVGGGVRAGVHAGQVSGISSSVFFSGPVMFNSYTYFTWIQARAQVHE